MSKRIYGLTIGEDKQWYDFHSIKILSIDGIYNAPTGPRSMRSRPTLLPSRPEARGFGQPHGNGC